jgi:hypothetical protein
MCRSVYPRGPSAASISRARAPAARTVFPALSRPRKRILAFLCSRPTQPSQLFVAPHTDDRRTELREDVPEPVDDEHDGFVVRVKRRTWNSTCARVSCAPGAYVPPLACDGRRTARAGDRVPGGVHAADARGRGAGVCDPARRTYASTLSVLFMRMLIPTQCTRSRASGPPPGAPRSSCSGRRTPARPPSSPPCAAPHPHSPSRS